MTIAIVTHPKNKDRINDALKLATLEASIGIPLKDIHLPRGLHNFPIYFNENLEERTWTGRWLRTETLPDDRFFTWVDDLKNPPSWAIYFGLVEKEYEYVYHLVDTAGIAVQKISYDDMIGMFDATRRRTK